MSRSRGGRIDCVRSIIIGDVVETSQTNIRNALSEVY
jgi:hypothetical protein